MRIIDADDFRNRMYHEVFEKDSDDQKWDSGCWIRYKLFERVLNDQPTIDPAVKDDIKNAYYDGYDSGYNAGFEAGQRDVLLKEMKEGAEQE